MQPTNRRLIVVDDEPGVLDAYRVVFSQATSSVSPRIQSSRSHVEREAMPANPNDKSEPNAPSAVSGKAQHGRLPVFEVTFCTSGEEVLEKIREGLDSGCPYVGGFFDVKLGGGIDGIETIRRAQIMDPQILVCIVSAYQDRSLEEIAKIFGEDFDGQWDFMMKPFNRMEILQKANNLVTNWEWRRTRTAA